MKIKDYFASVGISDELCDEIVKYFTPAHFNAGDTILEMGENTSVVYFILEGTVRGYYLDEEGADITKCFSLEGDWCCIYNYLSAEPSTFFVQAIEDCSMAKIKVEDLKQLLDRYTELQKIYYELSKKTFLQLEEKGTSFQMMNAKERYISFVENHPDINKRVKQEYIASYLGITPSSLSRIKRGL